MINNKVNKFHTMARKYCINRIDCFDKEYSSWTNKAIEISKHKNFNIKELNELTEQFNKTYPEFDADVRKCILKMMLNEIESMTPNNLSSVYQIKQAIQLAIHKATIHYAVGFLKKSSDHILRICIEEKQLYYNYWGAINQENMQKLESLPYMKVLSYNEAVKVKEVFKTACLERIWDYSYSCGEDILAFELDHFNEAVNRTQIVNILKKHNISRIYVVDTCNIPPVSYLMETSLFDLQSITGDVFWCSEKMDWGIVRDHEGIIYIYSKWLIQEIKDISSNLYCIYASH